MPTRREFLFVLSAGVAAATSGCAAQVGPYQAKATSAPPLKNCFDTLGHQPGFKPFVLGGTCYCNPLPAQIAVWRKEGSFAEKSDDEVIGFYANRNIKTLAHHRDCNNLCQWGPHVAKGGTCLVPPTPLTDNYEDVALGRKSRTT